MKKKLRIEFIITAFAVVLFCATVFCCCERKESDKVNADTDEQTATENTLVSDTEAFTYGTTDDVTDIPGEDDQRAQKQLLLDAYSAEIAAWIKENTPTYYEEAETDESGGEVKPQRTYKPHVSFYYSELAHGYEMTYDEDRVYFAASVIKEPYILWLARKMEQNREDGFPDDKFRADREFVYTEGSVKEGSGVIKNSEFGTVYTYLDLMRLTITQSDNVAFAELRKEFGNKDFNEYMSENGVVNPVKSLYTVSASDAAKYLRLTYVFFEGGSEYAEYLKDWMLSTNHRIMIPSAVKPTPVASKYGWDIDSYHDTAIVFDGNPYLLVILTELDEGTNADNRFVRELANKINEIHISVFDGEE